MQRPPAAGPEAENRLLKEKLKRKSAKLKQARDDLERVQEALRTLAAKLGDMQQLAEQHGRRAPASAKKTDSKGDLKPTGSLPALPVVTLSSFAAEKSRSQAPLSPTTKQQSAGSLAGKQRMAAPAGKAADPRVAEASEAFHKACLKGPLEAVARWLEPHQPPVDLNWADKNMWTPLHNAASAGKLDIVELLLVGLPHWYYCHPFSSLLLQKLDGVDVGAANNHGNTAIHYEGKIVGFFPFIFLLT
jgi:ankyrin repeat protein